MATFSQRNNRWQVKVTRKGFPTQYKSFSTKAEGQVWARSVETMMDDGTWVDPAGTTDITFGKLLERYKESVTQTKRSRRSEEYRIGKMMRHKIAEYSMCNLTTSVLADYRDQRLKVATNSCVCRELATISAVITHAQREWGLSITNPAKLVKRPRLPPGRNRMLKPAEVDRLLHELNAERHELRSKWLVPLVRLALETAMRQGELLSLLWKHIDFDERTAYLPMTKNGKDRCVPLSSAALAILESLERVDERVIPISQNIVLCAWPRACKRARIEDFRFHDLRHMATTSLAKRLPNVIELASVTGHSNVQMLKRYYHTSASELAKKLG
ncbi:tyrosine-type recombinase/integrase [Burkholderia guangdongensis]|uniref:tyrosine-type recombinase/integrase n=1 Tax=Burkholderia guangdongensis TaxID=1792500 RepID=UPI0015CE5BDF|nr:site-specific integrase [Burkholderia guangdongensis]